MTATMKHTLFALFLTCTFCSLSRAETQLYEFPHEAPKAFDLKNETSSHSAFASVFGIVSQVPNRGHWPIPIPYP